MKKLLVILSAISVSAFAMGPPARPKTVPLNPKSSRERLEHAKIFLTSDGKTKEQLRRVLAQQKVAKG